MGRRAQGPGIILLGGFVGEIVGGSSTGAL